MSDHTIEAGHAYKFQGTVAQIKALGWEAVYVQKVGDETVTGIPMLASGTVQKATNITMMDCLGEKLTRDELLTWCRKHEAHLRVQGEWTTPIIRHLQAQQEGAAEPATEAPDDQPPGEAGDPPGKP